MAPEPLIKAADALLREVARFLGRAVDDPRDPLQRRRQILVERARQVERKGGVGLKVLAILRPHDLRQPPLRGPHVRAGNARHEFALRPRAAFQRARHRLIVGGVAAELVAQRGQTALGALVGGEGGDQATSDRRNPNPHGREQAGDGAKGVAHAAHGLRDLAALLREHLERAGPAEQRGHHVVDLRGELLRLTRGDAEGVGGLVRRRGDRAILLLDRHHRLGVLILRDQPKAQCAVEFRLFLRHLDEGASHRIVPLDNGSRPARGLLHAAGDLLLPGDDLLARLNNLRVRLLDLLRARDIAGRVQRRPDDRQQLDAGCTAHSSSSSSGCLPRCAASKARRSWSSARIARISSGCSGKRIVRHHASTSWCWMACAPPMSE